MRLVPVSWDTLYDKDAACPHCGSTHLEHRTLREHQEWYEAGAFSMIEIVTEDAEIVVLAVRCEACGKELLNRYDTGLAAIRQALAALKG